MSGETKTPTDAGDGTRVDLGEDLLEGKTQFVPGLTPQAPTPPENGSEDLFQSARILINEGLHEEAKKVLRRIIREDPAHVGAKRSLKEIQELELKKIIHEESPRRKLGEKSHELPLSSVDADAVLKKLEEDLGLSLVGQAEKEEFALKLKADLSQASAQDRIDLGIAFLEMGLHGLAVRELQAALEEVSKTSDDSSLLFSAVGLLAFALILDEKPFEAISCIQPPLRDPDVPREKKTELFYLMGRACEGLKQLENAAHWYDQVVALEPDYRDVQERLGRVRRP